jgi:4-hydroxy-tetrahydrodipicolinate synthase
MIRHLCRGAIGARSSASFSSSSSATTAAAAATAAAPGLFARGVWPIMATPFLPNTEDVDYASFERSVSFMRTAGASGVTVIGVLGESNRLLDAEREQLVRCAVSAAGDMPVCVGTSHAGTRATMELSRMAQDLGAKAVMVTPSREPAPLPAAKMVEYFARVAEGIDVPVVLQDHPASTQVHMPMDLVARICREVPAVGAVKMESLPSPPKLRQLRGLLEQDGHDDVALLVGLGALYGAFDADAGMDGFMTGFAFPEVLRALVDAAHDGRRDDMHAIYAKWLPLIVYEQQPGVAVRKELYRLRGIAESGTVRHPGGTLLPGAGEALQDVIERVLGGGVDITKPVKV